MLDSIKNWAKKQQAISILDSSNFEYLYKYRRYVLFTAKQQVKALSIFYDDYHIIGSVEQDQKQIRLGGQVNSEALTVEQILDSYAITYASLTDYRANPLKSVDLDTFKKFISQHVRGLVQGVYSVHTEKFRVVDVKLPSDKCLLFIIQYEYCGVLQQPIRFFADEHYYIKSRKYGADDLEFEQFIKMIGENTNGLSII